MRYRLTIRLAGGEEEIEAKDLAEVKEGLRIYRSNNDVRASDWLGAELYDWGELIARLAYNGEILE